jgi:hypothetical protein
MPSVAVSCHGGRGSGTSSGTYVIPKGVTIYFFTDDAINLNGGAGWTDSSGQRQASGATWLEDLLLTTHPDEETVKRFATEVKREYETIPNYHASGATDTDPAFTYPTGLYWVGSDPAGGPFYRVAHNQSHPISWIIGGGSVGGVTSTTFYWLCCRYAPRNSNNTVSVNVGTFGLNDESQGMGLKPSQIVARGGHWR